MCVQMYAYVTMALLHYTPLRAWLLNNQKKTLLLNFILTLPNLKIFIHLFVNNMIVVIFLCLEVSVFGGAAKCAKFFMDSKGWNYGVCQPILVR